jgi:hypothetical protein
MAAGRGGAQMLFGSSSLEVLIGIILLFLVLAVIASAVAEIVSQVLGLRSKTLADAIQAMLFDKNVRDAFYAHPLIMSLSHEGQLDKVLRRSQRPSYIPADVFARALLDVVSVKRLNDGSFAVTEAPRAPRATASEALRIQPATAELFKALAAPLGPAVNQAGALAGEVEKWFDDVMDRVAGWYKRKTQLVLITIGVVVVIWANANVVRYASALATNPDARAAIVAAAGSATASQQPTTDESLRTLKSLDLELGWDAAAAPDDSRHLPSKLEEIPSAVGANLLGWLFAIAAVSMGAPFWFDLLKNVINLRTTGAPPKDEPKA